MYYGGIDVAKKRHNLCIIDESGEVTIQLQFSNSRSGFQKLDQKLDGIGPIEFCMEATGHYWLNLYCWLSEQGYTVRVINPIQSEALRKVKIRKTKTDRKDASLLAELLRMGEATQTKLYSETTTKLQSLSRLRFDMVEKVTSLKTQVLGILDRIFPEYPDCFSDVFIKTSRELLKKYPEPEEIASMDLSELSEFLSQHSQGRIKEDRAKKIKDLAQNSIGIRYALDAFTLQLRLLIEQIEHCQEDIKIIEEAIDKVLEELREDPETEYRHVVETPPGISSVTAAAIIGEIGDPSLFPNAKALVAFSGIDPSVNESGNFKAKNTRISKRGSPVLRHSLYLAASSAIKHNPEFNEYYYKKVQEGKSHKQAVIAVARRLVHLIYSLWKNNQPYNPNYQWSPPQASS